MRYDICNSNVEDMKMGTLQPDDKEGRLTIVPTITDESEGSSSEGGLEEASGDPRKLSLQSERSEKGETEGKGNRSTESKLQTLKDNVTRITQFLTELKTLSESCQEHLPSNQCKNEVDDTVNKDRQVRCLN